MFLRFFEVLRAQKLFCKCMGRRLHQHIFFPENVHFISKVTFSEFCIRSRTHPFCQWVLWACVRQHVFNRINDVWLRTVHFVFFLVFCARTNLTNLLRMSLRRRVHQHVIFQNVHVISTCAFSVFFKSLRVDHFQRS